LKKKTNAQPPRRKKKCGAYFKGKSPCEILTGKKKEDGIFKESRGGARGPARIGPASPRGALNTTRGEGPLPFSKIYWEDRDCCAGEKKKGKHAALNVRPSDFSGKVQVAAGMRKREKKGAANLVNWAVLYRSEGRIKKSAPPSTTGHSTSPKEDVPEKGRD